MIEFTQYLRPDGRTRQTVVSRSKAVERKAQYLKKMGMVFEAEVLTTNEVSFTVEDAVEDEVIAIAVVPNGPGVLQAIDTVIEKAYNILKDTAG